MADLFKNPAEAQKEARDNTELAIRYAGIARDCPNLRDCYTKLAIEKQQLAAHWYIETQKRLEEAYEAHLEAVVAETKVLVAEILAA